MKYNFLILLTFLTSCATTINFYKWEGSEEVPTIKENIIVYGIGQHGNIIKRIMIINPLNRLLTTKVKCDDERGFEIIYDFDIPAHEFRTLLLTVDNRYIDRNVCKFTH